MASPRRDPGAAPAAAGRDPQNGPARPSEPRGRHPRPRGAMAAPLKRCLVRRRDGREQHGLAASCLRELRDKGECGAAARPGAAVAGRGSQRPPWGRCRTARGGLPGAAGSNPPAGGC